MRWYSIEFQMVAEGSAVWSWPGLNQELKSESCVWVCTLVRYRSQMMENIIQLLVKCVRLPSYIVHESYCPHTNFWHESFEVLNESKWFYGFLHSLRQVLWKYFKACYIVFCNWHFVLSPKLCTGCLSLLVMFSNGDLKLHHTYSPGWYNILFST